MHISDVYRGAGPEGFAVRLLRAEPDGGFRLAGFDALGKEINGSNGYQAGIVRLDGSGRELERTWLRADGKPALAGQQPTVFQPAPLRADSAPRAHRSSVGGSGTFSISPSSLRRSQLTRPCTLPCLSK